MSDWPRPSRPATGGGPVRCYAARCRHAPVEYVQAMPTAGPHPACPTHAQRFCDAAFNYDGTWARRWPIDLGPAGSDITRRLQA